MISIVFVLSSLPKSENLRHYTLSTPHSTHYRQDYDGKTDMTCRPVNLLVTAYGPECGVAVRLGSATSTSTVLQSQVTQATVPAPALLLHSALGSLLLTLEVRLGEGLHRGQQTDLAHLPAEGDGGLALLAAVEVHDESLVVNQCGRQTSPERFAPETPQFTLRADFPLPGESDKIRSKKDR